MKSLSNLLLCALAVCSTSMAVAADAPKPYPLTTCVVSGEKLGTMGKPYVHKVDGVEVQFCCKSCLKDFEKNPKQFLKKLEEAKAKKP